MSDGVLKVKADIEKNLELNVAKDYMARHCDQYTTYLYLFATTKTRVVANLRLGFALTETN